LDVQELRRLEFQDLLVTRPLDPAAPSPTPHYPPIPYHRVEGTHYRYLLLEETIGQWELSQLWRVITDYGNQM
jgi:hypothetical protein